MSAESVPPLPGRRHDQVVDPDIDLHDPEQRAETVPREWELLAAIGAGGVVGAEARYGIGQLQSAGGTFPWATLAVNVSGCLLIGVLMIVLLDVVTPHRLMRPFLGVGVLGGYTTFSTFGVETVRLVRDQHLGMAVAYLLASVLCCLLAVWGASAATERLCHVQRDPAALASPVLRQ